MELLAKVAAGAKKSKVAASKRASKRKADDAELLSRVRTGDPGGSSDHAKKKGRKK